jgi:hypothetical protein
MKKLRRRARYLEYNPHHRSVSSPPTHYHLFRPRFAGMARSRSHKCRQVALYATTVFNPLGCRPRGSLRLKESSSWATRTAGYINGVRLRFDTGSYILDNALYQAESTGLPLSPMHICLLLNVSGVNLGLYDPSQHRPMT